MCFFGASNSTFSFSFPLPQDLTFIEDGNETFLDGRKTVVNWQKMRMIAQIFDEMQRFQQNPYILEQIPVMTTWLRKLRKIVHDDNELYEMSFQCQPRKK